MPIERNYDNIMSMLQNAATETSSKGRKSYKVENAFEPTEKDGKYSVVMRFLPPHPSEFRPWVENQTHMFKLKNGLWFGCDCLGKFNQPCPICKKNAEIWKTYGREEAKNHLLGKARPKYVCNVLIVKNPNNPDTEGKVFRFEFGPLIFGMLTKAATNHDDADGGLVEGFNPFQYDKGANFVFEGVRAGQFIKNDTSHFGTCRPINRWDRASGKFVDLTEDEIKDVESKLYTLEECEHKLEDVKSYDQILKAYEDKAGEPLFESNIPASAPVRKAAPVIDDDEPSFMSNDSSVSDEESVSEDDFFSNM